MNKTALVILALLCASSADAQALHTISADQILVLTERIPVRLLGLGEAAHVYLDPGTGVGVLSDNGNTFTVTPDGVQAFELPKDKLAKPNDLASQQAIANKINAALTAQLEQQRQKAEEERRRAAQAPIENAILKHQVLIGMTAEQCLRSWGQPKKIDRMTGADGVFEFWTYYWTGDVMGPSSRLDFKNGVLTTIHSSDQ